MTMKSLDYKKVHLAGLAESRFHHSLTHLLLQKMSCQLVALDDFFLSELENP